MDRRNVIGTALATLGGVVMLARGVAAQQQATVHRLALHVDQNDPVGLACRSERSGGNSHGTRQCIQRRDLPCPAW
jgi:hypothetical protein